MIYPWCVRRTDLDGEICSLISRSDIEVYDDDKNGCLHIFIGGTEFTSCFYPLNDQVREELRRAAFLLHNGIDADERQRIADANAKRDAYGETQKEEAKNDWRDESVWEYKHRFLDKQVTPMVVLDGGKHDG